MKLSYLRVENFKGIRDLTIPLTDELGRIKDLTLIVGPNGSGKTSILDAIWFGLRAEMGYRPLRRSFRAEPQYVVTTGERYAKVEYKISITEEERRLIEQWKDELVEAEVISHHPGPKRTEGHIVWTYPAQPGYKEHFEGEGGYRYQNQHDWEMMRGKDYARRLRRILAHGVVDADRVGGIFFFEQERQVVSSPVKSLPVTLQDDDYSDSDTPVSPVWDIRSALVDFGIKQQLGHIPSDQSWYELIRKSYDYICAPHTMGEVYAQQSDGEYEIDFLDGKGRKFTFDGLSSGERSVLNLLVQYYAKRMRNSIVLIDELELHLHPTWQRRLLQNFTRLEDGNQFIITTHSPILRQAVPSQNVVELGTLDDQVPAWQYVSEEDK